MPRIPCLTALALIAMLRVGAQVYTISTVAGSDWVGDGGPATQAVLFQSEGVAVDNSGRVYVSDALGNRVRQVLAGGTIRTLAGTGLRGDSGDGALAAAAQLSAPYGLAIDRNGNLFVADLGNARVRKVALDGTISTVAGPAGLTSPRNLAFDSSGRLYISDFGAHKVLRLNPDGSLDAVAGTGTAGYTGDSGPAVRAQLSYPTALAFDRQDNLYIADSQNHAIRKIAAGTITTVAHVATPTGLAFDFAGTLHAADPSGGQILQIPVIGPATALAIAARDVAFGPDGSLYASTGTLVRKVQRSGIVTTIAGGGNPAYGDGGDALRARLNHPSSAAIDAAGNLYIADRDNHRIRRVSAAGVISTIAGTGEAGDSGDGGPAALAQLNKPSSVSLDLAGNLYIADTGNHRVRRISPAGTMLPVTRTESPVYVLPDNAGSVYVSDAAAGRVYKAIAPGPPTPSVAAPVLSGLQAPQGLALDGEGNLYVAETGASRLRKLSPAGALSEVAAGAWSAPRGIAVDEAGAVFVADSGLQQVLRSDAGGTVQAIAGMGSAGFSGDGDAAVLARLSGPWDVARGPEGKLYVVDLDNNRLRLLAPAESAAPAPVRLADAVNSASLQAGAIAPGELVAIRGAGISAAEMGDTQILFGETAGTLAGGDATGLIARAPDTLPTSGSLNVDIRVKGGLRARIPVVLAAAAPALYPPATQAPIPRGSVTTLYGTGLGIPGLPVSVQFSRMPAELLYAGPMPAYPGVFQINLRVPDGLPPGPSEVVVSAGGASSPAGYFLSIL
jgi:uncharacterized protein (TIGR03437 family)